MELTFRLSHLVAVISLVLRVNDSLSPEGCEEGWVHFQDYCYSFIKGQVHFDTALDVCSIVKKSTLVTLWDKEEYHFVTENLKKILGDKDSAWIGIIPSDDKKYWRWADGSSFDVSDKDLPDPDSNVCGSVTTEGKFEFVDCDVTKPAFVCKKPLDILFLPRKHNETDSLVDLDQETIVFERQWPPILDTTVLERFGKHHLATIDVAHETDCAYSCYTIDDCRAFLLRCQAKRRCNSYACSLFSGEKRDEL